MNSRFVPKIEKPCPANWDEMQGDEKRRFCEHCQLHVHNLSAMTAKEQREVLTSKAEHKCISYVATPDAVAVEPGSWLNRQLVAWPLRKVAAGFALILSLLGVSCQSTKPSTDASPTVGRVRTPAVSVEPDGKRTAGAPVMAPRPLWKRLLGLY